MSKKIALRVPVTIMVRDRDIAVLAIIERAAGGRGREVSLGIKWMASKLGASPDTARRAVNACRDAGYLEVTPAENDDGGHAENAYRLTKRGEEIVEAARQAGLL